MATKRKSTKKLSSKRNTMRASSRPTKIEMDEMSFPVETKKNKFSLPFILKLAALVLVGVAIFLGFRKYRGQIIAAVVNKTPILRYQLNQKLAAKYGKQELESLIFEQLITQLAKEEGVVITDEDIQKELTALKERLGGDENLKVALEQYGLSDSDLQDQIRLSLLQRRLAEKLFNVEVTDEEIKTFYDENKELYKDKSLEEVKETIKEQLKQSKLQQEFSRWYEEKRSSAQIQIFI